jgi:small subunit ribosomal protein S13
MWYVSGAKMAEKEEKKAKQEKHEKAKEEHKEAYKPERRLMNVIRLGETNLDGNKKVGHAIMDIKGISFAMSKVITDISGFGGRKISELSEHDLHKLDDIINNPEKHGVPSWMFNRRKEPEKGMTRHITTSQLDLTQKMDIDRMKKIKSYKGVRHILGQPVRGQRTRSSFRSGGTVGVQRAKGRPGAAREKESK